MWCNCLLNCMTRVKGCELAQLVTLVSCSKKVLGFITDPGSFWVEFACSLQAIQRTQAFGKHSSLLGNPVSSHSPKTIGPSKLPLGTICMVSCPVCFCVAQ
ncbi:hypothetical protein AMECASPLE_016908 [Ameca splendens]|uniref:Secreted protein n=1 Tax=Ameca splendens TaxID=208324 RepID=A0ABV0XFG4_9TELE